MKKYSVLVAIETWYLKPETWNMKPEARTFSASDVFYLALFMTPVRGVDESS